MVRDLYNILISWLRLARSPLPRALKFRIGAEYARLRLKARGNPATEERVLGREWRFFNYQTMVYLFEEIFIHQAYAFQTSRTEPVIVDAGANVGLSILYFKTLWPQARIVAFEPDPKTFERLEHNVRANGFEGVTLHNVALLDREGEVEFFTDSAHPGSPAMSTTAQRLSEPQATRVPCRPFSAFLQEPVDFIKMDIEGAEGACLTEAGGRLKMADQIVIECHHNTGVEGNLPRVLGALEKAGFGYQVGASPVAPFLQRQTQDVHVYAYQP